MDRVDELISETEHLLNILQRHKVMESILVAIWLEIRFGKVSGETLKKLSNFMEEVSKTQ